MASSTRRDAGDVTAIGDGIVQLRLPMAGNPLRYINGYLVEDDDGFTLIDCGWKADDVLAALNAMLAQCERRLGDLRRVIITHAHYDHYGLAGTLMRKGVPELVMHAREWQVAQTHVGDLAGFDRRADAWIAQNGWIFPNGAADDDVDHHRVDLIEPTRTIADGERLGRLLAIHTPGHTPGHICLRDERSGMLFSGDHVLDPITPHVGYWLPAIGDPLGDYLASLARVKAIGAASVLPAHLEPFADLATRVDELLTHHDEREAAILRALAEGPASAGDVARALPWTRRATPLAALSPAHQQFAVAETLAHLEHLRTRGAISIDEATTPIRYSR